MRPLNTNFAFFLEIFYYEGISYLPLTLEFFLLFRYIIIDLVEDQVILNWAANRRKILEKVDRTELESNLLNLFSHPLTTAFLSRVEDGDEDDGDEDGE